MFVIPAIAAIVAAAIPAVVSIVQGAQQRKAAKRIAAGNKRPTYTTPASATEALDRARNRPVYRRMPGQGYGEERLGEATASGVRATTELGSDPASILAAISSLFQNQQDNLTQYNIEASQSILNQEMSNEQNLQSLLLGNANYQDRAFEMNQLVPYNQGAAAASALLGAGMQNQQRGLTSLSNIGVQAAGYNWGGGMSGGAAKTGYTIPESSMGGFQGSNGAIQSNTYADPYAIDAYTLYQQQIARR